MTFKKDYINYVLYTVVNTSTEELTFDIRMKRLAEKIASIDDVVKITYMLGKTAGLEFLFKYILYISDKIDKSQITIFNLKDNFDYDIKNLTRICAAIQNYKNATHKKIDFTGDSKNKDADNELEAEKEIKKTITIDLTNEDSDNLI